MMAAPGNPKLEHLSMLVGRWEQRIPRWPEARGHAEFDWVEDGAFLRYRTSEERGGFPASTCVIGADDALDECYMLYHDERGVCRVLRLSFGNGVLRMWRDAPGFSQRFSGEFKDGGRTIDGRWEKSFDGSTWELDFDMTFARAD
jgi:hypothetical protein